MLNSKVHCIALGAAHKKAAELFFPADFADDFPVSLHISARFGFAYVVSKMGLLFVYDVEQLTAVYRQRISADPVFLAQARRRRRCHGRQLAQLLLHGRWLVHDLSAASFALKACSTLAAPSKEVVGACRFSRASLAARPGGARAQAAPSFGGLYVVTRRGSVLRVAVNGAAMVPFIAENLKKPDLAIRVATRGDLPGAEPLFVQARPTASRPPLRRAHCAFVHPRAPVAAVQRGRGEPGRQCFEGVGGSAAR